MATKLDPDETLYPDLFPIRRLDGKPKEQWVQADYGCIDTFTPLLRSAIAAARGVVDCAVSGAMLVETGERYVHGLCRPPGHHAERRLFGGFCSFNNAAIAAHRLARRGRVARRTSTTTTATDRRTSSGSVATSCSRRSTVIRPRRTPYFSGFTDEIGVGEGSASARASDSTATFPSRGAWTTSATSWSRRGPWPT